MTEVILLKLYSLQIDLINQEDHVPGQLIKLHASVAVDSPEQLPPLTARTVLFLVFVSIPEPHVILQLPLIQAPH